MSLGIRRLDDKHPEELKDCVAIPSQCLMDLMRLLRGNEEHGSFEDVMGRIFLHLAKEGNLLYGLPGLTTMHSASEALRIQRNRLEGRNDDGSAKEETASGK